MMLTVTSAVPLFAGYAAARGLSPGTVKRHRVTVGAFARACREVKDPGVTVDQIDHECIAAYMAAHEGGQGARNNKLESLKAFLNWAHKSGYLATPPNVLLDGYKCRKAERQPKYYLDREDFPAALEAAGGRHPADRAIVALALYTLARASEIAGVRLCDYDAAKGEIRLYREKRDRWTTTGVTPELASELYRWEVTYAREMGYLSPHMMIREHPDWLLVPSRSRGHGRLQPTQPVQVMERVAKRVLTDLGVTTTRPGKSVDHLGEGMHTFRRSGARAFLKALSEGLGHERALTQVKIMLDHDDLQQTMRYIGVDQEKDELNEWLKGNSMYGETPEPPGASVIPIRRFA
jgi:integrase